VDTPALTGKILFVIREVGIATSTFTMTIE